MKATVHTSLYLLIAILVLSALFACQRRVRPEAMGAGLAVLYQLTAERRVWMAGDEGEGEEMQWLELKGDTDEDDLQDMTEESGGDSEYEEQDLLLCSEVELSCSCPDRLQAEASVIFVPEGAMRIQWMGLKGDAGPYHRGSITQESEQWFFDGEGALAEADCEVDQVRWDHMHRLLAIELKCEFEGIEGDCRVEDTVHLVFPERSIADQSQLEEKPWNSDTEERVFRPGDDPASLDFSSPEIGERK